MPVLRVSTLTQDEINGLVGHLLKDLKIRT
jgi:hypothetical protein